MKNSLEITNYVYEVNQKAIKLDRRYFDFIPPQGFIICSYCDNGKIVLIEANGKGGQNKHVFPPGFSFTCEDREKKKPKSWIRRLLFK